MPSLMDLPPELQTLIIERVVLEHREPPSTPSKTGRIGFEDMKYLSWERNIYHEPRPTHNQSNSGSLLLTNQRLSAITQTVLARIQRINYTLDISVLNDVELYPTWVYVPRLTNRVSTLTVDVRLFGHVISREDARAQVGDGGRLGIQWSFYALLERFLRYGPVGEKKGKKPGTGYFRDNPEYDDREVVIDTLVLDFESAERVLSFPPAQVGYNRWSGWLHVRAPRQSRGSLQLSDYTTRPEWCAAHLMGEITAILDMDYHTALYGMILYEQIGRIQIRVNGEVTEELDIAHRLAEMRFTDAGQTFGYMSNENRISAFWKWKKWVLSRRQELGLPVVWPADGYDDDTT